MPVCGGGDYGDGKPGPVPHLLPRAGAQRQSWGAEAGPGEPRRERLSSVRPGERVPGARRDGAGAPRKAAAKGSRGERRGQASRAAIRPCGCPVCPPPPFALLDSASVFFFFFKKKTRLVCPRRAARAASRTHNLLIFPVNISELHNGI